jgi:hypothetical protein
MNTTATIAVTEERAHTMSARDLANLLVEAGPALRSSRKPFGRSQQQRYSEARFQGC